MKFESKCILLCASMYAALSSSALADTIPISLVYSLTGPIAFAGVDAAKAAQIAIDDLNASGRFGKNTLKLITYDDGSSSAQTRTLIARAATGDNALIVLGPTASIQAQVAGPVANDLKIPLLSNATTADLLKSGQWAFKVAASPPDPILPLAAYALDKLHTKRAAIVYKRDNEGDVAFAKVYRDYMTAHGIPIVADESMVTADTDFAAIATKLADAKPDTLFLVTESVQAANVVLQAKQAGVSDTINIVGNSGLGADYVKLGGRAVEGTYLFADYDPDSTIPMNVSFVQNYKKRFNDKPTNWAGLGYSAVMISGAAIEAAGPNPTRDSVRAAMANLHNVPVIIGDGTWSLDSARNPKYAIRILTIKDGKFVTAP